jgi:arginyl-tRNA synthetase
MSSHSSDLRARCEAILTDRGALEHCVAIEPRRDEGHQADLRLIFADRKWLRSAEAAKVLESLADDPSIESARCRKSAIYIRFTDDVLALLEQQLAAGELLVNKAQDFASQNITIGYVGPNTNKALHVGHLRNLVVGEALASAYEAAGVSVRRHNLVGDIGRRVGEAMAGYLTYHRNELPEDLETSGDRFVELCCREYVENGHRGSSDASDPNAEERTHVGDLADDLMKGWLASSEPERTLWDRMRQWVLDGHDRTLMRMGTRMDHYDFESENLERAVILLTEGIERGIVEREDSGAVVYKTIRSEYPTMVLIREDGFPTEHGRLLGTYDRILDELEPDEPYLEVAGYEWEPPITVLCELHKRLRPGARHKTHQRFYHASVTWGDGAKIGSSTGNVLWINDLLDEVVSSPKVMELEAIADGVVTREVIADTLVRGAFLSTPASRSLPFPRELLLGQRSGPAWKIAEAWCRLQNAEELDTESMPTSRTLVMHSLQYWPCVRRVVERRDVSGLFRYLVAFSEECLSGDPRPAAVPTFKRALRSLGFVAGGRDLKAQHVEGSPTHEFETAK